MNKFAKIAAIATAVAMSTPMLALAAMNSSSITITTTNSGNLDSSTTASAFTGLNTALGSTGGEGGNGGDVEVDGLGSNNNGGAETGNGGNGGAGGAGGWVDSGDATADAGAFNQLNTNDIDVGGDDEDMNSSSLDVGLTNSGNLTEATDARARTGLNTALGSTGGEGGNAGDSEVDGDGDNNNGGATTGNGGTGGVGGLGGTVLTGVASATSGSFNVSNTNIVRVRN